MTRRVVLAIAVTYLVTIVVLVAWQALGIDASYFRRACC